MNQPSKIMDGNSMKDIFHSAKAVVSIGNQKGINFPVKKSLEYLGGLMFCFNTHLLP